MKPTLDIAATLECEPELLPYLPEILTDFDALGSDPPRLIELIERADVAAEIRTALDLCCGKGATSIAIAAHFGIRIDGVDALRPFIDAANRAAAANGVGHVCRFTTGDLCDAIQRPATYDLVLFCSVGPILGGNTQTVRCLAQPLRPRGLILIEDSVLLPGAPVRPGFEAHADLDETRRQIEVADVTIVALHQAPADTLGPQHEEDLRKIRRRADALVQRRPDLADLVERYVARQREECVYLERWTRDVTWLLRRD